MLRTLHALFALFALFASPALAGSPCTDKFPPPEVVALPTPAYELVRLPPELMTRYCGEPQNAFGRPVLACADADNMKIYVVRPLQNASWLACLVTHEEGHLKGKHWHK